MTGTHSRAPASIEDKVVTILAGIGLYVLVETVLGVMSTSFGPYVILYLAVPSTDVRCNLFRALFPQLALLPATMLIGWRMSSKGWLYGLVAAGCLYLPGLTVSCGSFARLIQVSPESVNQLGTASGWPYTAPFRAAYLWLGGILVAPVLAIAFGALGGFLGQWCYQQWTARVRRAWAPRLRRLTVLCATAVLLVGGLCVASHTAHDSSKEEVRFRELFGESLNKRLLLVADKSRYGRQESVSYWVENRTSRAVWFHDQSLDVRGYGYDTEAKDWIPVDLGLSVTDPVPTAVETGVLAREDSRTFAIPGVEIPQGGKLRLVVTGHTNLKSSVLDQVYTAYRDMVIVR